MTSCPGGKPQHLCQILPQLLLSALGRSSVVCPLLRKQTALLFCFYPRGGVSMSMCTKRLFSNFYHLLELLALDNSALFASSKHFTVTASSVKGSELGRLAIECVRVCGLFWSSCFIPLVKCVVGQDGQLPGRIQWAHINPGKGSLTHDQNHVSYVIMSDTVCVRHYW